MENCQARFEAAIAGLMDIPPAGVDPRPYFVALPECAARHHLPIVSMEMSFYSELAMPEPQLGERLSVEQLANVASISPRQFAQQFTYKTGETHPRAVERLRCEASLPRIEATTEPLDQIAFQVGSGDLDHMRKVCVRIFGQPPQAVRQRCRAERNIGLSSESHGVTT